MNPITIFTKPWKCSIAEIGEKLAAFGADGLELPVRPGYPVSPENMMDELPRAARELERYGQRIYSVAASADEETIAACGAAGVPIIRVCERVDLGLGYMASVRSIQERYMELLPALKRHNVTIGVQNHCNKFVGSAIGVMHLIEAFDPAQIAAVLDVAHCGLSGEPEDMAMDIVWSHLCMVNLKSAFRMRINGPEAEEAEWRIYWTSGRHGYVSWRKTARLLRERGFTGPVCLTAEYSDPSTGGDLTGDAVDRLVSEDVAYAKSLFASAEKS